MTIANAILKNKLLGDVLLYWYTISALNFFSIKWCTIKLKLNTFLYRDILGHFFKNNYVILLIQTFLS